MKYIYIFCIGVLLLSGVSVHGEVDEHTIRAWFPNGRVSDAGSRCCSSVLFIPGFKGTRLLDDGRQLWEANSNSDVRELFLDESGQSLSQNISTGEMIRRTNIGFGLFDVSIYEGIANTFDDLVQSGVIKDWDILEYDWRLDLPMTQDVFLKIRDLAEQSYDGKVMLVGHSNGGLMVKKILSVINPDFKEVAISSTVLVATPQLGSAQAVGSMLHGDGESVALGFFTEALVAREWGRNMPAAYNLLPSEKFLLLKNSPLITFEDGSSIGDFSSLISFLQQVQADGFSLNANLLSTVIQNHADLDNADLGVPTYEIAGINYPTTSGLSYFTEVTCVVAGPSCIPIKKLDYKNMKTSIGDGVVEFRSAVTRETILNTLSTLSMRPHSFLFDIGIFNQTQNKNINHATILEAQPVQDLITSIIKNTFPNLLLPPFVREYNYSQTGQQTQYEPSDQVLYTFGVHSPVTLHIIDSSGRTTERGKTEIPNSVYEEAGEGKYITILEPKDSVEIKIQGTGVGRFSFDIQKIIGNNVTTVALFSNISVSSSTKARYVYSFKKGSSGGSGGTGDSLENSLEVDIDDDGVVDETVQNENQNPVNEGNILEDTKDESLSVVKNTKNRLKRVGKRVLETVQNRLNFTQEHEGHEDEDADTEDNNEQDVGQVSSHSDESVCYPC